MIVGWTNGCFDLFHPGHVHLLKEAKAQCDWLVVGVNTDESVRELKGQDRPHQALDLRMRCVNAYADSVLSIRDDLDILLLVAMIRPQVLIKGSDYRGKDICGASTVLNFGGRIHLVERLPGLSTTELSR